MPRPLHFLDGIRGWLSVSECQDAWTRRDVEMAHGVIARSVVDIVQADRIVARSRKNPFIR